MDSDTFRKIIGTFATGVAIVTTEADGRPYGMTVNSLSSVSLDPPLLLVCADKRSATGAAILKRGRFVVNLLSEVQRDLAYLFSRPGSRFGDDGDSYSQYDLPAVPNCLAYLSYDVFQSLECGDHIIVVASVVAGHRNDGSPLLFFAGTFGSYSPRVAA